MKNAIFAGVCTVDQQYLVDKYPAENEKINALQVAQASGGPATNAAFAFSLLGGKARLTSLIGKHPFTDFVLNELEKHQITLSDVDPEREWPFIVSSIITSSETGSRNVFSYKPRINCSLPENTDILKDAEILLIDGFYPEMAKELARHAKENNIPVVFDGGSWKEKTEEILPLVDFAICSSSFFPPGTSNTNEIFDYLQNMRVKYSALTNGENPILYQTPEIKGSLNVKKLNDPVDTLGAGDFFHGAFCYYLDASNNFVEALNKASDVAGFSCGYFGTRTWMKYFNTYLHAKRG